MALTRLQQLSYREETSEGVAESAADLFNPAASGTDARLLVIEPTLEYNVPTFQRNILRGTLTPEAPLTGIQIGTLRFSVELAGGDITLNNPQPPWGNLLRSCGFRQSVAQYNNIGAITGGPFLAGERLQYTGSPPTEWRPCVKTTYDGEPRLYWGTIADLTTGAAPGSGVLIRGQTSGATATTSSTSQSGAGYAWWPTSTPLSRATGVTANAPAIGDQIQDALTKALGVVTATGTGIVYYRRQSGTFGLNQWNNLTQANVIWGGSPAAAISVNQWTVPTLSIGISKDGVREYITGARGTVSFAANLGEPCIMQFEFQGRIGAPVDGPPMTGITYVSQVPPVFLDASFQVGEFAPGTAFDTLAEEAAPCIGSFTVDIANELSQRQCANTATGLLGIDLTGRSPTATFDPETSPEASFDWVNNMQTNTKMRARWNVGNFGSTPKNAFTMEIGSGLVTAMGQGDRNGQLTRTVTVSLNAVGAGTDNEFTLLQRSQQSV